MKIIHKIMKEWVEEQEQQSDTPTRVLNDMYEELSDRKERGF